MLISKAAQHKAKFTGEYVTLRDRPVVLPTDVEVLETIERDIHRTFPLHAMFSEVGGPGQQVLLRVLRAYAQHDKRVGYCQGMGFITAMFLSYLKEEDAFFLLWSIMSFPPHSLTGLYSPNLPKVRVLEHQLQGLLKHKLPRLYAHFDALGLHPTMYSAQWFMTIFTYNFPFSVVVRIWDSFLLEGWKVVFRVALGLLKKHEETMLRLGFEETMGFFRTLPARIHADDVMKDAFAVRLRRRELDDLEDEYKAAEGAHAR